MTNPRSSLKYSFQAVEYNIIPFIYWCIYLQTDCTWNLFTIMERFEVSSYTFLRYALIHILTSTQAVVLKLRQLFIPNVQNLNITQSPEMINRRHTLCMLLANSSCIGPEQKASRHCCCVTNPFGERKKTGCLGCLSEIISSQQSSKICLFTNSQRVISSAFCYTIR